MSMHFRILISLLLILTGSPGFSEEAKPLEDGFVPLFNGTDLTGWELAGGKKMSFFVRDGAIYCDGSANYPHWLRTDRTYENFILRFEFMFPGWCENGLYVHAPLLGWCSKIGMEFQISHDIDTHIKSTGAIFPVVPPMAAAAKDENQWNSAEIVMDWPIYRATLNGTVIQDLNLEENPELRYRNRSGYIGLQDGGWESWIRNISIKELPGKENWIPLLKDNGLEGWKLHVRHPERSGGGDWRVEDGVLVVSDGDGHLINDQVFEDCEIQMYVRTENVANGGVFFRWKDDTDRGYEIQIFTNPDSNNQTGSLYGIARASHMPARDGEWFPLQIIVKGSRCIVRVNGETVVDYDQLDKIRPGHIALQMHKLESTIWYKDVRVKEL
ncbi:MAG: DUF1080 domain-containing protein [bacterium]